MQQYREVDLIVIGGGPAGLSSAVSAKRAGASQVVLIERDQELGGILPQCIHTGFGLAEFKEELTGPEYAGRWIRSAREEGIEIWTNAMVLSITREKLVTVMGLATGILTVRAKAIILAMGCREKTRGALGIPGYRPAGIFTAGCAQRLVNIEGFMPGKTVFILGSGDIGLIMARRLTLEGARVTAVCERMDRPGGLARNVQQCLNDFGIPLYLSSTVFEIHGKKRVEGVTIGQVSAQNTPVPGTLRRIDCDTLLLSVGLIPENELSREIGMAMDPSTGGPLVDETMQTSIPGIYACGNVLKVYDLVDHVTEDAVKVGEAAARRILRKSGRAAALAASAASAGSSAKIPSKKESPDGAKSVRPSILSIENQVEASREILCTVCPKGCIIQAAKAADGSWTFEGYTCKRGLEYAKDEILHPKRVLTTSVLQVLRVCEDGRVFYRRRLIAVRSSRPIPLDLLFEAMERVRRTIVRKALVEGDVVLPDILGTHADIIVTRP